MPGNRFAFAVRVRRKVDLLGLFGLGTELLQELSFALDRYVLRRKIMRNIDPEAVFRQILDVPNGCLHRKTRPEIFFDRSGFCRGFNNDQ